MQSPIVSMNDKQNDMNCYLYILRLLDAYLQSHALDEAALTGHFYTLKDSIRKRQKQKCLGDSIATFKIVLVA